MIVLYTFLLKSKIGHKRYLKQKISDFCKKAVTLLHTDTKYNFQFEKKNQKLKLVR